MAAPDVPFAPDVPAATPEPVAIGAPAEAADDVDTDQLSLF